MDNSILICESEEYFYMFYVFGGFMLEEYKIRYGSEINHSRKWWPAKYLKFNTLNKNIGPTWNKL